MNTCNTVDKRLLTILMHDYIVENILLLKSLGMRKFCSINYDSRYHGKKFQYGRQYGIKLRFFEIPSRKFLYFLLNVLSVC